MIAEKLMEKKNLNRLHNWRMTMEVVQQFSPIMLQPVGMFKMVKLGLKETQKNYDNFGEAIVNCVSN